MIWESPAGKREVKGSWHGRDCTRKAWGCYKEAWVFLLPVINQITVRVWTLWSWEFWTLTSVQMMLEGNPKPSSILYATKTCLASSGGVGNHTATGGCFQQPFQSVPRSAARFRAWGLKFHLSHQVGVPVLFQTPYCLRAEAFLLALFLGIALDFCLQRTEFWGQLLVQAVLSLHQRGTGWWKGSLWQGQQSRARTGGNYQGRLCQVGFVGNGLTFLAFLRQRCTRAASDIWQPTPKDSSVRPSRSFISLFLNKCEGWKSK